MSEKGSPAMVPAVNIDTDPFPFFKLPLELRCMVYGEYIAGTTIIYDFSSSPPRDTHDEALPEIAHATRHVQSLSKTCRAVHAEFEEELGKISKTSSAPAVQLNLHSPCWNFLPLGIPLEQYREVSIVINPGAISHRLFNHSGLETLLKSLHNARTARVVVTGEDTRSDYQTFAIVAGILRDGVYGVEARSFGGRLILQKHVTLAHLERLECFYNRYSQIMERERDEKTGRLGAWSCDLSIC